MKSLLAIFSLTVSLTLLAQKKEASLQDFIPSENIDADKDFNQKRLAPETDKIAFIVMNSTEGLLYGNACMLQETRRMGFEYSVQTPKIPGSLNGWKRFWNNTLVRSKLVLTRGPFWKSRLKRKVEDCRRKSGDLTG